MKQRPVRIRVLASFLAELESALEAPNEHLEATLSGKLERFWPDGPAGVAELGLLGAIGALEANEAPAFLDGLARAAADPPGALRLATEHVERREELLDRLRVLAAAPTRRRAYFELARGLVEAADASWRAGGRARAAARAAALERAFGGASEPLSAPELAPHRPSLELLLGLTEPDELVLLPSACGALRAFDLPGRLVVLLPQGMPGGLGRARTDELAHRARAIADPTRLGLLDALATAPATVGELAPRFGLAQPTVSNHLRQLRDAGLVREVRAGNRRVLEADADAIVALGADIGALGISRTPR